MEGHDIYIYKGVGSVNRACCDISLAVDGGCGVVGANDCAAVAGYKFDFGKIDGVNRAFDLRKRGQRVIGRFIRTLFGFDPVLLDVQKRAERLEGTIDGDVDWMLVCKPKRHTNGDDIKCDNGSEYRKLRKDET